MFRRQAACATAAAIVSAARAEVIKGISYGPVPLKSIDGASQVPADDWFCDEAVPMWGEEGRGDLAVMKQLGANMVRLYGNNPQNDHTNFLDEAWNQGLSVAPGMSDYPYYQMQPGNCLHATDFNCFTQVKPLYSQNLHRGFLTTSNTYHPALKYMNIINEPDLKIPPDADGGSVEKVHQMCRAIISAFDGMLEAEKEAGVTGPLINFTATFSFAICSACEFSRGKPALSQMAQLDDAMRHPGRYGYSPKNNITDAYLHRFTHSFNTANPAQDVKSMFLDAYELAFPSTPVYIAEYHRVGANQVQDVALILEFARNSPVFLGISFFQFQVAYWKTGSETEFGMFGLGTAILASMPYFTKTYDIFCLTSETDAASGMTMPAAIAQVYGGVGVDDASLCAAHPGGVKLNQEGYLQIATQHSTRQMSKFVQRLFTHVGVTVRQGHSAELNSFVVRYSDNLKSDAFAHMASYIGSNPDWVERDPAARCVADRNAPPSVVGAAIGWVCSQNLVDCESLPPLCKTSPYTIGDYVFSRYSENLDGDALGHCGFGAFGGAALFAPSQVYNRWTSAALCAVDGATTTSFTTTTVEIEPVTTVATTPSSSSSTSSSSPTSSSSSSSSSTSSPSTRPVTEETTTAVPSTSSLAESTATTSLATTRESDETTVTTSSLPTSTTSPKQHLDRRTTTQFLEPAESAASSLLQRGSTVSLLLGLMLLAVRL